MTEKKTKGKKAVALPDEINAADPNLVVKGNLVEPPEKGPDYHITDAGEILLDSGGAIPEDHPVHPAHRALAAVRKTSQ